MKPGVCCISWKWSYKLGEKEDPQINATGFLVLLTMIIFAIILNFFAFISAHKSSYIGLIVIVGVSFSVLLNLIIIFKKTGYKKKIKEYEFVSEEDYIKKRYLVLLFNFFSLLIVFILSAIINNKTIQNMLFNL